MLLCFNQQLRLFLAIIILLFFIQIVYNLETEAVIHLVYMWKWLLLWFFMTCVNVYPYKYALPFFNKDSHSNEVFIVICITAWVNVKASCAIKNINTHLQEAQTGPVLPAGTSHTNMHIGANMNDL